MWMQKLGGGRGGGGGRRNRRGTRSPPRRQSFPEDQYTQPHSAGGRAPSSFPASARFLFPINDLFVAEKVREPLQGLGVGGRPPRKHPGAHDPNLLPSEPGLPKKVSTPLVARGCQGQWLEPLRLRAAVARPPGPGRSSLPRPMPARWRSAVMLLPPPASQQPERPLDARLEVGGGWQVHRGGGGR